MDSAGGPLADALKESCPGAAIESSRELERVLGELVAAARAAWPGVEVEAARFVRYLGDRVGDEQPVERALASLHCDDLYLACACGDGDRAALAAFDARFGPDIARAVARVGGDGDLGDEVCQALREKLFLRRGDRAPKIGSFAGRSTLSSWVRAVAARTAIGTLRGRDRRASSDPARLEQLAAPDDPGLQHLQQVYQAEFKAAFGAALGTLSPRDRAVLSYYVLDNLSLHDVGVVYGVHTSTVSRWLTRIREQLLRRTEAALRDRLRVSRDELDSILRLVRSRVDVSIRRHLAPPDDGSS